jgi:hypothetical protein
MKELRILDDRTFALLVHGARESLVRILYDDTLSDVDRHRIRTEALPAQITQLTDMLMIAKRRSIAFRLSDACHPHRGERDDEWAARVRRALRKAEKKYV